MQKSQAFAGKGNEPVLIKRAQNLKI